MPSASTATPNGRPWAIRLSIEVSRTSTRRDNRIGSSRGNSSAISVRVAPADFPMPMARWPAERPMATTRYHRWVVMASVIRLLTSWTPTVLAVSKPKVGAPPGSGRSLSMVFGTCATRKARPADAASRDAENAVSSPPIVTSASIPSFRSDSRQACSLQSGSAACSSRTVGLAREVRMIVPPWTWILDTSVMDRGRASSIRPSMRCWKPSMIPRTSHPEFRASIVAAEMTEFMPGAGPPPHRIPSFTAQSFQPRGGPGKHRQGRTPQRRLTGGRAPAGHAGILVPHGSGTGPADGGRVVGDQPEAGDHLGVDGNDLVLRTGDPRTQGPAVDGRLIRVDHPVRHAHDDHAPAEVLGRVDLVGLVGHHGAGLGPQLRGDRGVAVGADDHVVPIDEMGDRPDSRKRPGGKHDPAQRDAAEQPHALLQRQLFEPSPVIRRRSLPPCACPRLPRTGGFPAAVPTAGATRLRVTPPGIGGTGTFLRSARDLGP